MTPTSQDLERLRIPRPDEPRSPFAHGAPERRVGRGRGRRIALAVALAGLVAALGGWWATHRAPVVRTAAAEVTGGLTGPAGQAPITANGYVVARTKASVAAKIAGRLAYLGVSEGSHVRKGEILARLEGQDVVAALEAARARAAEAQAAAQQGRSDLTRARALAERGAISAVDLENARTRASTLEAAWRAAVADARLAAANVENLNVRAPFEGTVLRKDAEVGEVVSPTSAGGALTRTAIVTMADLATLEVEVDVNEAYIARISNGQPARITLDAYPDTSFAGRVRQVVPTADRQKATVLVKVSILDQDPRILPEMGARVDFVPPGQSAAAAAAPRRVWVPALALVSDPRAGVRRVFTLGEQDRVKAVTVTTGGSQGGRIEVKDGLAGDETVVVAPPTGLRDGAKVRRARP